MPKIVVTNAIHKFKEKFQVSKNNKKVQGCYCSVPLCGRIDASISSFMLPKDPELRARWLNFLQTCNKEIDDQKSRSYRICERHFETDRIRTSSERKGLMYRSVPTLDFRRMRKLPVPKNVTSIKATASYSVNEDFMSAFEPEIKVKVEVKEEPLEDDDDERQLSATVIQTYIKEEPLDIKQEVIYEENDPLALPEYDPALTQLNEMSEVTQTSNSARDQLRQIEQKPVQIKRRSRTMLLAKPLIVKKTEELPATKNKKHILCFICYDKFTSNLTFEMHLKLMHKDVMSCC